MIAIELWSRLLNQKQKLNRMGVALLLLSFNNDMLPLLEFRMGFSESMLGCGRLSDQCTATFVLDDTNATIEIGALESSLRIC